ncbi:MAG: monovalent cation/H(+) antiporter subunit G [Deltaproteobacteria bacterium]|nr:monovalent cation/H(+) antiporter subunit G [Deltaproteobacteria bacterium]
MEIVKVISVILILGGCFFFITGTIGFLRFPDFYSRMHATGKGDTLAVFMAVIGFAIYQGVFHGAILDSIKLVIIAVFVFLANPFSVRCQTMDQGGKQMIWQLDLILCLFVLICAIAAINVKDLLAAVIILGAYSFFMCLLWTEMGAVDVAFTEASVGAGVGTVLFIAAVSKTKRRSKD